MSIEKDGKFEFIPHICYDSSGEPTEVEFIFKGVTTEARSAVRKDLRNELVERHKLKVSSVYIDTYNSIVYGARVEVIRFVMEASNWKKVKEFAIDSKKGWPTMAEKYMQMAKEAE